MRRCGELSRSRGSSGETSRSCWWWPAETARPRPRPRPKPRPAETHLNFHPLGHLGAFTIPLLLLYLSFTLTFKQICQVYQMRYHFVNPFDQLSLWRGSHHFPLDMRPAPSTVRDMAQTSTPDRVTAVQDLRRSSASQRHTPKRRKGTRKSRKDAALREWR